MSVSPFVIHYVRPSVSVSVFLCLIVCICLFSPQSVLCLFLSESVSLSVALYAQHPSVSVFLCLSVSISLPAAVLHIMKLCGTAHVAMRGTFTRTHTSVRSIIQVHVVVKNSPQTHY